MLEAKTIYQGETPVWHAAHDTDGAGTLADLSSGYTCKVRVVGTAIDRAVSALTVDNKNFVVSLTKAETTALAAGAYIVAIQLENTSLGFNAEDQGILTVNTQAIEGAETPDIATMELAALRQSRSDVWDAIMAAARGERIKEVWRDGRRVVRENMSVKELREMLDLIDGMIRDKEIVMGLASSPRRTAIGLAYR